MTWLNSLTGTALLALLFVGVVAGVRWLLAQESRGHGGETPLDIVKKRYARGELTKEEFEVRKRDITL
jgi:putative membrane protein